MKTKIVVLVPVWKRPEIFKIFCERFTFPNWVDGFIVAIISRDDPNLWENVDNCEKHDIKVQHGKNNPMGAKMNIGISCILKCEFDYLMNIGSDDVLSFDYWKKVRPHINNGSRLIGMNQICAYEVRSGEAIKLKLEMAWGGGRLIKFQDVKDTWDKLGFLYTPHMPSGLDTDSLHNMIKCTGISQTIIKDCLLIDLKTSTNLNTYNSLFNINQENVDYEWVKSRFGDIPSRCAEIVG